jgi:hypothetical protein
MTQSHLERALAAEEEVESLGARIRDLNVRLKGALNSEPTTAVRALSWMHRAENGEKLIAEVAQQAKDGLIGTSELPAGWLARAEAQLAALKILRRDHEQLMEVPDADEAWEKLEDGQIRHIDLR